MKPPSPPSPAEPACQDPPAQPRRRFSLRIEPWQRNLYIIILAQLIGILGFSLAVPFLPFYLEELGASGFEELAFWVGFINSAGPIVMALASPVWGAVADRYGRKPMLVRAFVGGGVVMILMALAQTVPQLATLRIIQGALSGSVTAATVLVATCVPPEQRGYALGLLQSAIFAGHSLGPMLGGTAGGLWGYRVPFVGAGVLLMIAGLVVTLLVHETFERPAPRPRQRFSLKVLRGARMDPMVVTMLVLMMMNRLSTSVTLPMLPLYVQTLVATEQQASTATGWISGATSLANAIAAVAVGKAADRLGRRRVLLACLGLAAVGYMPQMLTTTPLQLLLLRAITGFAGGGLVPVSSAILAERAPEGRHGAIYGLSSSLTSAGRAVGPVIGTVAVTQWGLGSVFPITGVMLALVTAYVAMATRGMDRRMATERVEG